MSRPHCQLFFALLLAPWIALWGTLAPEHVHESDGDHPQAFAHRHLQPHEIAAHDHDHDGAEIDHGDGHLVWVDDVGAYQRTYRVPTPDAAAADRFELVPVLVEWIAAQIDEGAPPHGPPRRPQSLRAPPTASSL